MTIPMSSQEPEPEVQRRVDARTLWSGGAATAVVAALIALVATALMHLLLLSTPRPRVFFTWILGLATVIAVVFPFSTTAPASQKVATGLVNLVLGIAIGTLLGEVSARATQRRVVRRSYPDSAPPRSRTPDDGYR